MVTAYKMMELKQFKPVFGSISLGQKDVGLLAKNKEHMLVESHIFCHTIFSRSVKPSYNIITDMVIYCKHANYVSKKGRKVDKLYYIFFSSRPTVYIF